MLNAKYGMMSGAVWADGDSWDDGNVDDNDCTMLNLYYGLSTRTIVRAWEWTLDAPGNWSEYKVDANGDGDYADAGDLDQDRSHNLANEIDTDNDHTNGPADGAVTEQSSPQQTAWLSPKYDARGNLVQGPRPGDEGTAAKRQFCTYDAWNRLVRVVEDTDGDGTEDVTDAVLGEYRSDGLGRRIRKFTDKTAGENPTWTVRDYYNAGWQVLEVRKESGKGRTGSPPAEPSLAANVYEQYVWSARYVDAPVLRDRDSDKSGGTEKAVAESWEGGTMTRTRTVALVAALLVFVTASPALAMYHPTLGRFAQRDPIGYVDGVSVYEYVGSSPPARTDPEGTRVNIVESQEGGSRDGASYEEKANPKTGRPVLEADRKTAVGMRKALEEVTDTEFEKLKKAGKVTWNKRPFTGTRQEYMDKLKREEESSWVVQKSGGPDALKAKAAELKGKNTDSDDQTGIGVHGRKDPKTGVTASSVTVNGVKTPTGELMGELGKPGPGEGQVDASICYPDGGERGYDVEPAEGHIGKDANGGPRDVSFTPPKMVPLKKGK